MKISIQGIEGSFHHQAATLFAEKQPIELIECETFRDVFSSVKNNNSDYGVVAIENSLHGSINPVYRLLSNENLKICGEVRLKIELFLIGAKYYSKENWVTIEKVISQSEALNQCEQWLNDNVQFANIENTNDTAASVRWVMRYPEKNVVAVAGKNTIDIYGGEIIAGPINDDPNNYTRFFIISKNTLVPDDANRTSIILQESDEDKVGTLYEALGIFSKYNINLSKLDSHPLPGVDRKYAFYLDFDTSIKEKVGRSAIEDLKNAGWKIKVLGSYKSFKH